MVIFCFALKGKIVLTLKFNLMMRFIFKLGKAKWSNLAVSV